MEDKTTHKIPVNAMGADELPRETPLKYDDICRVIGDLYLRLNMNDSTSKEQFEAVVGQLQSRIHGHLSEISRLKTELSKHEHRAEKDTSSSDTVGEG